MIPGVLDEAKVLYYSAEGDYGTVKYSDGMIYATISFFAICRYENDDTFYLFGCDDEMNVISDTVFHSAEECMTSFSPQIHWIPA